MKSMTGFGKATYSDENYEFQFEIKSVNNKNFDLKIVSYKELNFLENEIKDFIFQKIKRGKIDLRISFRDKQIPQIEVDENRVRAYYDMLQKVKSTLALAQEISLDTIINEPNVVVIKNADYDTEEFRKIFFDCLRVALDNHQAMAINEGTALKAFFIDSFAIIEQSLNEIKETIPAHREKLKENLTQTVKQILATELSPEMEKRILLETALYLDRCDITEEIIRLESHLKNIKSMITTPAISRTPNTEHRTSNKGGDLAEKGKSMNFILQEMQREANTISSKYTTSTTFMSVLRMKEEVEKCREQIQNVE